MSIITCLLPSISTALNITSIPSGIYIEHLGYAYTNRGTLRISLTIPWNDVKNDSITATSVAEKIDKLCRLGRVATSEIQCADLSQQLQELNQEVQQKIHTLVFMHPRKRRGVLGDMLTTLFGVNDRVYHDIDDLNKNQQKLIQANRQHGKLMLSALQTMNRTNEKMQLKLADFNSHLNHVTSVINGYTKWYSATIDGNKVNLQFLSAYQRAENFLSELNQKYSSILNSLYTKNRVIECLNIAELYQVINRTEQLLPKQHKVYHIPMNRIETTHTENKLTIFAYLQIIDTNQFELIKPTAVPKRINEKDMYAVVDFSSKFLAIDYNKQLYYELDEATFNRATRINDTLYIINVNTIYEFRGSKNCVIHEIFSSMAGKGCISKIFALNSTVWIALHNKNSWIFLSHRPITIFTLCHGVRHEYSLKDSGIIQLPPSCSLHTPQFVLISDQEEKGSTFSVYFKPKEPHINMSLNLTTVPTLNTSFITSAETFAQHIQEAFNLEEHNETIAWKPIVHHGAAAGVSVLVSCTILTGILLFIRKRSQTIQLPLPTTKWYDLPSKN
ncbi:unnamed protein product [Hermetia illucens]|uniref:Uncharacterized protein n=1 Tax=Hermetia illucens TaxID=343691 RepID=A0A7R8YMJ8_HERIL|nr:unnamed protein product [Hermetia illucens]